MTEKPILFKGEMVRAIINGTKTQTRRIVKPQPQDGCKVGFSTFSGKDAIEYRRYEQPSHQSFVKCPYPIGTKLWVKETFRLINDPATCIGDALDIDYKADGQTRIMDKLGNSKWKPSIFMPHWASRITLEVTGVRVERLQDISGEDAAAEGITIPRCGCEVCAKSSAMCPADASSHIEAYAHLWESINGKTHPWSSNPWVWVYTFKRISPPAGRHLNRVTNNVIISTGQPAPVEHGRRGN